MSESASNSKRIAKNTLLLYGRMMLIMAVQLYTSRVVLNTLGVEDYGIYNVVGGIVVMFVFFNAAMITSTQRYITFELGKGDFERLRTVFTSSLHIHIIISVIIFILSETIGLWFLYNKMVIPEARMVAAQWVFQLSILTMVIQVMSVPYNSLIIAHENMEVFAAISIVEVILKLVIIYVLVICKWDKLILYAILLASVQLLIRFVYTLYCKKHYKESEHTKGFDKELVTEMGKFAGWNLVGNAASTLMGTGVNLLLNVFFGPAVNAARAIAVQVENAITQFSSNFMMAVNPQITKLYAQEKKNEMHKLIFRSSKFTFFLLLAISLPVFIETKMILTLWLKIVPDYTVQFLRLLIIISLFNAVALPLQTAAAATGKVRKYQMTVGGILLSILPISYITLKLGGNPLSVYLVYLGVCIVAIVARLLVVRPLIQLSLREYMKKVVLRCALVFAFSFVFSWGLLTITPNGVLCSILICVASVITVLACSYLIGMNGPEKVFVLEKIKEIGTKLMGK